jgi:valyl-tRNA synthetase
LKNYVAAPEVLDKYGTDAARQWAAGGGATGADVPFRWQDVEYGRRFLTKLWNAGRFVSTQLTDYKVDEKYELQLLDKWILVKSEKLTQRVTDSLEKCQFNIALEEIRNFTWHVFCDQYIEAVKDRLYRLELYGAENRKAVQFALYSVLYRVIQLLAPMAPHVTEEIYETIYAEDMRKKSLQLVPWPVSEIERVDEEAEKKGELVMAVITEIRREKSEKRKSLNTPIKSIKIYAGSSEFAQIISENKGDIAGTCKISMIEILSEKGIGRRVQEIPQISFASEY